MRNLQAEMKRYGVTVSEIQELLGCSEKTVRNKLNQESEFSFPETIKIRDTFFSGMKLEYLFIWDEEDKVLTEKNAS